MTTAWRPGREAEDVHAALRGQGAMPLALRLTAMLGIAVVEMILSQFSPTSLTVTIKS